MPESRQAATVSGGGGVGLPTREAAPRLAHPLDDFYSRLDLPLPPLSTMEGEEIPQPYRSLLVHSNDMTSTLESFHSSKLHLRLIGRRLDGNVYFREVVLVSDRTGRAVEFGAIKIFLDRFPAEGRRAILEEKRPLGALLREHAIVYESRPSAFLRLASDQVINEALGLSGAHVLYGRRNSLLNPQGEPLAEIVEILPPAAG